MNDPFLSFPVPYPWSRFRRTPSTAVLTTTRLNLTCITELRRWVDTPMIVTHSWKGPSGNISHSSSHPRVSNVTQVGQVYWSSIFFSSGMRASDSGIYICIVSISSVSPYIAASGYVAGFATYLSVGKEVACTTCKCLMPDMFVLLLCMCANVTAHCHSSPQGCDWHQLHSTWGGLPASILQSSIDCHPDLQSCGCNWSNKIPLDFNM